MKTSPFFFLVLIAMITIVSCKKESTQSLAEHTADNPVLVDTSSTDTIDIPDTIVNNHIVVGDWHGASFQYSLSFFTLDFVLGENGTGTVNAIYNETGHTYDPGILEWETSDADSIAIYFEFPAYPEDGWVLKGVINETDTEITGDTYNVPLSNHSDLSNSHGVFTLSIQ